ncbi:RNA polymerase factor sigma-54 [Dictyobacter aurantiacus]|uniref:RNA polymerase sigma-54 factor n=1 Tax=Dictyobacter aurantiacus TaxID=1936993 RepID=A0A401ZI03_9CHLR|nr:RNA polymerase factor sigma-54 [Dictyobacter aurantiacus]GCE06477.1 RNA polymerase sigma-54 factor [Dictyobacter aurantiacus]
MRLEQTPRTDQNVRISARLVTSSTILHLSADELERTINQEQTENPALQVTEQRICQFCSTPLYGPTCTVCGRITQNIPQMAFAPETPRHTISADSPWEQQLFFYDSDNYGFNEADNDDAYDPMARIPTSETLVENLLHQLEALIPPEDAPIAEQLVGNLDSRGYLEIPVEEIARHLRVPLKRVTYVLGQLQTLEPVGFGARNPRECLLLQLTALKEQQEPPPLAEILIDRYLEQLGHNQFAEIARKLKVTEAEVRHASDYISAMLHPYPSYIYNSVNNDTPLGSSTSYIHPDIIIRKAENGFEVELMEEKRYNFRIETHYAGSGEQVSSENNTDIQKYMYQNRDRAKFFVDCIRRRWRTLRQVAELVVSLQKDFLEKGTLFYLYPLTRAEVASILNLDEGTVSRATANKYALLPNGRLIPIAGFFDGSMRIKDMLRELIQAEKPCHRLSDEELAHILAERGIPLARRTVAKYREEMGIGSSRERGLASERRPIL